MKKQEKCSICNKKFKRILSLGYHPCADTFVEDRKIAINLKRYPLEVGFCECNHLTSINKVSPFERYQKHNYSYTANNSPVSLNHFNTIAKRMVKDFNITSKNSVLEIGSNDGTFLKNIKDLSKVKVLGIDPSDYMCKLANKKGIRTLSNFFNYYQILVSFWVTLVCVIACPAVRPSVRHASRLDLLLDSMMKNFRVFEQNP